MKLRATPLAVLALLACAYSTTPAVTTRAAPAIAQDADTAGTDPVAAKKPIQPPASPEPALAASPRENNVRAADLKRLITQHFDQQQSRRSYIQVDKPLYKPGETIWFKTWDLKTREMNPSGINQATVELVSPKGAVVLKKRLRTTADNADTADSISGDFTLPDEAQGGEYSLRATMDGGQTVLRPIIVSGYEAPRMKKTLEFVKKAYGAGDTVSAAVELKRPTGEVLDNKVISAVITIDGQELPRVKATTNQIGAALIKFDLPKNITTGEGLLTILVEDGGITESISKSIPIIQKKLSLAFFPEGGKMVAGLPSRLYFEAKTPQGKPADVEGRLIDDSGQAVAKFSTFKNGLGRIEFTPASGRTYRAEITRPNTVTEKYALPLAEEKGCVLRSYDDFDGQAKERALRVSVRCSEKQKVVVAATVRENFFDAGSINADSNTPGVIYLRAKDEAMARAAGVARVTVFDQNMNPLAERLVFRNRRERLDVKVETDRQRYTPRGQVALTLTTRDPAGKPVAAELALSVVDDTVLSFADDKTGHLLSSLLLEPELPGKIEEPNFYLDLTEAQSAMALDLLMGARGYRRFEWQPVLQPNFESAMAVQSMAAPILMAPQAPAPPAPRRIALPEPVPLVARRDENQQLVIGHEVQKPEKPIPNKLAGIAEAAPKVNGIQAENKMEDKDFARADGKMKRAMAPPVMEFAPVRVFPVPDFNPNYAGARDDYRETVFWIPSIKTDSNGRAKLKFVLSDAVTSFRVLSEGVGGGAAGRDETVFKSSLPFSLAAKLPLEVSAGDQPLIPVTITNDSAQSQKLSLDMNFGSLMQASTQPDAAFKSSSLGAGERKTLFVPLQVTGVRGQSQVRLQAAGSNLTDEVLRSIPVAPTGFPQLFEKSGQIKREVSHEIALGNATPGSVEATVRVYTSPLSTMISGLEGMLREPGGCFEQTSSTNYPNVMIMQYLKQHDVADPALQAKSNKLLESGYKKLTGFEARNKGFEWFGGDPGHEALTAYGLLEFIDMKDVSNKVDPAMLARTSNWLRARRDGKGGYLRDAQALDSFGRANPAVTNAYITWALVTAGETGLENEIALSAKLADSTTDAYQLALAANTLLHTNGKTGKAGKGNTAPKLGLAAAERLAKMQTASGAWTNADHSITRSGGLNLHIETTSLAVLALLKTDAHLEQARKGIAWLQNNRSGFGQWGATQATVLALKAMIAFDNTTRIAPSAGKVTLLIDGVQVAEQSYEAGQREPIIFTGFDDKLVGAGAGTSGNQHRITLRSNNDSLLPYSIAVEYRTVAPTSSNAAVVDLSAKLAKSALKMGETVRLDAVISNKTQTGQPMTLARLGLPGGLSFQNAQLKELREKGQIAFFETRAREVILYFRDLKPGEVKKLALDLVATVPGRYTSPASSAYLYYNDSDKSWAAPLVINITP